jgi:hypothetical protein
LFSEQPQLLRFDGIGRVGLKAPLAVKYRAEHHVVGGLRELDGAVNQGDAHTVTIDDHVFDVRRFSRIHQQSRKRGPHRRGRRRRRGLRTCNATREK